MSDTRKETTDAIVQVNADELKSQRIQNFVNFYEETKNKLDSNEGKFKLLNDENADEEKRMKLLNELLYFDDFKREFDKTETKEDKITFYKNISEMNK